MANTQHPAQSTVLISLQENDFQTLLIDCINSCLKHHGPITRGESLPDADRWFDLKDLVAYDPEKRTKETFYRYISERSIPFHKKSKKLIFLKSEVDFWLKSGRKRTVSEVESEAHTFLKRKRKAEVSL